MIKRYQEDLEEGGMVGVIDGPWLDVDRCEVYQQDKCQVGSPEDRCFDFIENVIGDVGNTTDMAIVIKRKGQKLKGTEPELKEKEISMSDLIQQMKDRLKCELELTNMKRGPDTCLYIKTLIEGIKIMCDWIDYEDK